MIATAFLRALSQFGDGRFQRVLALGIGLTVALLAGMTWLSLVQQMLMSTALQTAHLGSS